MGNFIGTCHFCSQRKPLCNAHIYPQSFYKRPTKNWASIKVVSKGTPAKWAHGGVYDPGILCKECDNLIGQWDDYAIRFFRARKGWVEKTVADHRGEAKYFEVNDYKYPELKLFFISLLWKASISSHDSCKTTYLGPFEDEALKLLRARDPGGPGEFSATVFCLTESQHPGADDVHRIMYLPSMQRGKDRINSYRLKLNEYVVLIKVDSREALDGLGPLVLRPNPPFAMIIQSFDITPEFQGAIELRRMLSN